MIKRGKNIFRLFFYFLILLSLAYLNLLYYFYGTGSIFFLSRAFSLFPVWLVKKKNIEDKDEEDEDDFVVYIFTWIDKWVSCFLLLMSIAKFQNTYSTFEILPWDTMHF